MVKQGDLIRLAYTPDLTAAGIAYARQQLTQPSRRSPRSSREQFYQLVIDKAVELAFRRYLVERQVPCETAPGTTFGSHALTTCSWVGGAAISNPVGSISQRSSVRCRRSRNACFRRRRCCHLNGSLPGCPVKEICISLFMSPVRLPHKQTNP